MKDQHNYLLTGFPSPADEYRQSQLHLHNLLVRRPMSTFFARFEGDAMIDASIFEGDLLVIERLAGYQSGQIVLAFVGCERLVRQLQIDDGRFFLLPANPKYRAIEITEETQIFGRVLHSITHHFKIKKLLPGVR